MRWAVPPICCVSSHILPFESKTSFLSLSLSFLTMNSMFDSLKDHFSSCLHVKRLTADERLADAPGSSNQTFSDCNDRTDGRSNERTDGWMKESFVVTNKSSLTISYSTDQNYSPCGDVDRRLVIDRCRHVFAECADLSGGCHWFLLSIIVLHQYYSREKKVSQVCV